MKATATEGSRAMVNHLGGRMYGDGEYVVEFHVSSVAPLSATVLGPGALRGVTFSEGVKPSIDVARRTIALARVHYE